MPFELGLDFGCRHYGGGRLATKVILVLEEHRYRYQVAISDLAGSDIEAHHGDYQLAVRRVRNWLAGMPGFDPIGAARVLADYEDFQEWHYARQRELGSSEEDIQDYSTAELLRAMSVWHESGFPGSLTRRRRRSPPPPPGRNLRPWLRQNGPRTRPRSSGPES